MATKVISTFGVYGRPSDDEIEVLSLADDFRAALCAIYHRRHRATVDYRDRKFPAIWAAMVEHERLYAVIAEIEKRIKASHSDKRDRNYVAPEDEAALREARDARAELGKQLKTLRAEWSAHLKAFGQWWKNAADWKNVKSLEARRAAYAGLEFPEEFAEWGAIHCELDLAERDLYRAYQARGLHSAIRAEIVESSKPKLKKDGPGMRYFYGRKPEPKPWQKLTLQFVGGATWAELVTGTPSLRITPIYTNHPAGGAETVVEITQQIGTADHPRTITYRAKIDRPIDDDNRFQRWTLAVRDNGKRELLPLAADQPDKPAGNAGAFGYRLRWTVRAEGVEVAKFAGDRINESLILPRWLVAKRMATMDAQAATDNSANDLLESRGISRSKKPGSLHGVEALRKYCVDHPTDSAAGNRLDLFDRQLRRAAKDTASAIRCIEDIYRVTASRVCKLHGAVWHPPIDLAKVKRYDTRDLLREDVLPPESRTILAAVAPGKLRAAIAAWGLASSEVEPELPADARETDVVMGYVRSLGVKTGTKPQQSCRRSQMGVEVQS